MATEMGEQPHVLQRVLDAFGGEPTEAARRIQQAAPRFVLLAARGTSDHAALYAKYLIETRLGLPAGLVSTSTHTVYGASMHLADTLWIAISQSGRSPDLVESSAAARRYGALTLAVTNSPDSPLAQVCELQLHLHAGPERSVAATKSYTASLLTLWLLVAAWGGLEVRDARRLPALAAEGLATDVEPLASHYRFASRLVATSRGYAYPTAREAALKLMETCHLQAQAFSGADLLHGPIAMVGREHPVVAVMPSGPG
jgi:glucosamine--fructose-6-phosphate aminotransferase (isomerizing)